MQLAELGLQVEAKQLVGVKLLVKVMQLVKVKQQLKQAAPLVLHLPQVLQVSLEQLFLFVTLPQYNRCLLNYDLNIYYHLYLRLFHMQSI